MTNGTTNHKGPHEGRWGCAAYSTEGGAHHGIYGPCSPKLGYDGPTLSTKFRAGPSRAVSLIMPRGK